MTENEAIEVLNEIVDEIAEDDGICYVTDCNKEPLEMAIQALEENQQYHAIGTVEDILMGIRKSDEEFDMLMEYRAIGTVEEFKALKEKAEPYKPQEYEDKYYGCKCGEVLLEKWEEYPKKLMPKSWGLPYCLGCGQKLDWS